MLKVAAECHLHGLVHRDMKPEVMPDNLEDVQLFVCEIIDRSELIAHRCVYLLV